jgi:hypothetical protein
MKAALYENRKNNIFSLIRIFYSPHVWKGHGSKAYLQASYCAEYKLGYPSNRRSTDKWIKNEQ